MTVILNAIGIGICILLLIFCLYAVIRCMLETVSGIIDCYYESKSCAKYSEQCRYKDLSNDFDGLTKSFKKLTWVNVVLLIFSFAAITFAGYTLYNIMGIFFNLFV